MIQPHAQPSLPAKSPQEQLKDGLFILVFGVLFLLVLWISKHFHLSLLHAAYWVFGSLLIAGIVTMIAVVRNNKNKNPSIKGPAIVVGKFMKEKWYQTEGLAKLPLKVLRHILITGITGVGKSTLLRWFMSLFNRKKIGYCYIDFKGEEREFQAIIQSARKEGFDRELQIFDLSRPETCATLNLLTTFSKVEETVGFAMEVLDLDHPYYRSEAEQFIRHALTLFDATKTLRSFRALEKLLTETKYRERLIQKVVARDQEKTFFNYFKRTFEELDEKTRSERFSGLLSKMSALNSEELSRIFNAEVSTFEIASLFDKNRPTIIRIPGEAYGDLSKRIVQAFIKMVPVLLARRRLDLNPKDYFLFLDEQCSYTSDTIVEILKKAGSAKVHCVLTRQCDGDFVRQGDGFLSQILSSCSVLFTFQTLDAETRDTLSKHLGTTLIKKQTWRVSNTGPTGEASEREAHEFNVGPNRFLKLNPGECILSVRLPYMNFDRLIKVLLVDLSDDEEDMDEN